MIYVLINALIEFGLTLSMTGRFIAYLRLTIHKNTIYISRYSLFSCQRQRQRSERKPKQNKIMEILKMDFWMELLIVNSNSMQNVCDILYWSTIRTPLLCHSRHTWLSLWTLFLNTTALHYHHYALSTAHLLIYFHFCITFQ